MLHVSANVQVAEVIPMTLPQSCSPSNSLGRELDGRSSRSVRTDGIKDHAAEVTGSTAM
jgi:hypothetical protein